MTPVGTALAWLVRGYQLVLRPLFPPACRFEPSCSAYAIEALRTHGALHGLGLASCRIARCNPFCDAGYDPVPPKVCASAIDRSKSSLLLSFKKEESSFLKKRSKRLLSIGFR